MRLRLLTRLFSFCLSGLILFIPICAHATPIKSQQTKIRFDSHASTLGAGFGVAYDVSEQLSVRIDQNYWKSNQQLVKNNRHVHYDTQIKMNTVGVILDYYPSQKHAFFVSSGIYQNRNALNFRAQLQEKSIGTVSWESSNPNPGSLEGQFRFQKYSPYFGFGYQTAHLNPDQPLQVDFAAGILFQGPMIGNATAFGDIQSLDALTKSYLKDGLMQQTEQDINRRRWIQYYPVIHIGLSYHF